MKKVFSLIGIIVGTQFIVSAPAIAGTTYVSGVISTNTVWDPTGSPYIVTGNVLVDTLITLDIKPGVEVRIDEDKYIMIKGNLYAIGTETDSIIISARDTTKRWERLWFKPASIESLKYCRIEYAGNRAVFDEGASSLWIGYNTISNNSGGGISTSGGTVTHNTITNNSATSGGGIYASGFSIIDSNIISGNSADAYAGGICCCPDSHIITNNTISNNTCNIMPGGIGCYYGQSIIMIKGNIITDNSGYGIRATGYGDGWIIDDSISGNSDGAIDGSFITLRDNFIQGNITGCSDTIINNTIYGLVCGSDLIMNNTLFGDLVGSGNIINNTISGKLFVSSANVRYNTIHNTVNIEGSALILRTNNLSATGYAVYNNTGNNIDARYNWWNTVNTDTIDEKIYDYYEDFNKGVVFYQPFLNEAFSDTVAPTAPVNLTANGSNPSPRTNDPEFVINWTNPADPSRISEYYYKLSSAPTSDFDTTGTFHTPPDTITATQENGQLLYVWLIDSTGNLDYNNYTSVNLRYDITSPQFSGTTIWQDTTFTGPFPVSSTITDFSDVISPTLYYRTNLDTNWADIPMDSIAPDEYEADIPVQVAETEVEYYLESQDAVPNTGRDPENAPDSVYPFTVKTAGAEESDKIPEKFVLFSPTPNPSQRNTLIKYGLPEKANMTLRLYDISGRLVKSLYSGTQEKGYYEVDIKQDELKEGIYFIRLDTGDYKATKKLTILR